MNGSLKENDSDDDGQKPSFGTSLDHLKARPSQPSQSRQSRRLKSKRSSSEANNDISIKLEEVEQACLRRNSHQGDEESTPARVTSSSVAALSKVKAENGRDHVEYPRDRSPTLSKVGNTPKSNKKRKVYDEKQFEGMKGIPDRIDYDLDVLFCGINPGVRSSEEGFHYAHPSNRFYRILHDSGLTPYRLKPSESPDMPTKYKLGLTDLVLRCTARADQVPSMEFQAGATLLLKKMVEYRPKMVCFVGMDVYRQFRRHFATVPGVATPGKGKKGGSATVNGNSPESPSKGKGKQSGSDVQIGLQNLVISVQAEGQKGSSLGREDVRLFVIPSTSGLAAGYSDADRIGYLTEARQIVADIRSGSLASPDEKNLKASIVVRAEDFMEDQIVRLASGEWAFVAKQS